MLSENSSSSASPLRILHVVGSLNRGGIETWLRHAIALLPRERYQCDLCTYRLENGAYSAELRDYGSDIHHVPLTSGPLGILRFSNRFRHLLRAGSYDVVHCHGLLLIGPVLLLAWLEKTPFRIAHAHSTDRKTGRMASVANRVGLTLNRVLARAFSTQGIGCSAEAAVALFGGSWQRGSKYKIIHCGIDLTPFLAAGTLTSQRGAFGIPPGVKVIGHVGSFGLVKNHQFLVTVAAHVFSRRPDIMLLLVGDGQLRPLIEASCEELGIRHRVIFAGLSSRVPELMRFAMDIFLMPSIHEGLPLVLLEAQAAGLPCLVSDIVSREAMISNATIHFLPLASGVEAWADAVLALLERSDRRPDVLARMTNSDFNVAISAKRMDDLYTQAQGNSIRQ